MIFEQVTQENETLKEQLNAVQQQVTLQNQMQQQLLHQLQTIDASKQRNAAQKQTHRIPPTGKLQAPLLQQLLTLPP